MKRAQNTTPAVPPCRGWHGALRQPSQLVPPQSPAGREPLAVNRQPLAVRARARRGGTRLRRSWGGGARAVPQPPALRPAGGGWRRHSGFGSPGLAETRSPLAPGAPQRAAHTHGDVSSPQPGCWAPAAKGKGGWGGSLLPPCNERIGEAPSTGFAYMYLSACTLSQFLWGMSTVYFIFFSPPLESCLACLWAGGSVAAPFPSRLRMAVPAQDTHPWLWGGEKLFFEIPKKNPNT